MHITAWWGWLLLGGGVVVFAGFLWMVWAFIHFILHFLDGW